MATYGFRREPGRDREGFLSAFYWVRACCRRCGPEVAFENCGEIPDLIRPQTTYGVYLRLGATQRRGGA